APHFEVPTANAPLEVPFAHAPVADVDLGGGQVAGHLRSGRVPGHLAYKRRHAAYTQAPCALGADQLRDREVIAPKTEIQRTVERFFASSAELPQRAGERVFFYPQRPATHETKAGPPAAEPPSVVGGVRQLEIDGPRQSIDRAADVDGAGSLPG